MVWSPTTIGPRSSGRRVEGLQRRLEVTDEPVGHLRIHRRHRLLAVVLARQILVNGDDLQGKWDFVHRKLSRTLS